MSDVGTQVFKQAIAEREERRKRLERGLEPAAETARGKVSTKTGGGEESQEDRMNELAAKNRRRRFKQARNYRRCYSFCLSSKTS